MCRLAHPTNTHIMRIAHTQPDLAIRRVKSSADFRERRSEQARPADKRHEGAQLGKEAV